MRKFTVKRNFAGSWMGSSPGLAPCQSIRFTSLVYDIQPRWTPDGTRLMVGRFSYTTVSGGLSEVSWPDGAWRELAPQPKGHFVDSPLVTNDGSQVVFDVFTNSTRIMAASVAKLVGGGTEE